MRILIATDHGVAIGGAETQMLRLRERLRARGHEVRLFASTAFARSGLAPRADDWCRGGESAVRTLLQVANPSAHRSLGRVMDEFRPEVVHVAQHLTQLSPLILLRLREVPSLYHAQWYRSVCPLGTKRLPTGEACSERWGRPCLRNRCLPRRDWPLLTFQLRCWHRWRDAFDLVVANSEATRRLLCEHGMHPVETAWNGVPIPTRPAPPTGPPRVVFAGRLVPEKGVDVLLRAFARLPADVGRSELLVAGDGPERRRLARLATELGLGERARFTGHLDRDALDRQLAGAWVQVVPSLWEEPFGLVATEAMARGTAVVASAAGGLKEIVIHDETGSLVPPGDVEALAAALGRLLRDRELASRMGAAGRRRAEAFFSLEAMTSRFLDLYAAVTRHAAPAAGPLPSATAVS